MRYDSSYRDQIFWDSNSLPGIQDLIGMLKTELRVPRTKLPATRLSKLLLTVLPAALVIVALVTGLSFAFTKSPAFTIVLMLCTVMICMGIAFIVISVLNFKIFPKFCTLPVEATCIGFSVSGGHNGSSASRPTRSPVFRYDINGFEYTAFDGVYENHAKLPSTGDKVTIMVNPDDPEEMVWNFGHDRFIFMLLGGIFGICLGIAFILISINDDAFMKHVREDKEYSEEKIVETASGKLTDDGRIIIDDAYIDDLFPEEYKGKTWVIGIRTLESKTVSDDGLKNAFIFEADSKYAHDGINVLTENMTEAMKNTAPGDKYYYIEVGEGGGTIFCCSEFSYEGTKTLQ